LRMIENVGHQRHLFWPFFAHFVTGSFSVFVVILNVWRLLIYYKAKRIATLKCAFFMSYRQLKPWMDTIYNL
jgi:D-arabinose 1-dehydrogenase-like Zn-dependent alcohol dehydrogenase